MIGINRGMTMECKPKTSPCAWSKPPKLQGRICRIPRTDLDLDSPGDLTPLAVQFERRGIVVARPLTRGKQDWFCGFALPSDDGGDGPESQITAALTVIESLDADLRAVWEACSLRLFDIGFDGGREPFHLQHGLSPATLARLAAVGGTLRITLYAVEEPDAPEE